MNHYTRISLFAFGILMMLILMQVNWLYKAVQLHKQEQHQSLKRLMPDIAMAVNGIDHEMFHGEEIQLDQLSQVLVQQKVDSVLRINHLEVQPAIAMFQTKEHGLFWTNAVQYRTQLLASDLKSCISCIVSFSVVKGIKQLADESDDDFRERLMKKSSFQYFSPVDKLTVPDQDTLWLTIYHPGTLTDAFRSLMYLFVINILLLVVLLILFRYLLQSLTRHKKLNQVKDDFFSHMTHEFKTPLSSIRLASRVLRQSTDPQKNVSYHQLIERESQTLEKQIDQLLMLSLLDDKGINLERDLVDLHALIEDIPDRLHFLIQAKEAHISMDLAPLKPEILGDEAHLSNSLCNLVENSLKYGGVGVEIYMSTSYTDSSCQIRIRDNGPGIAMDYQPYIFDRFFRGQKHNQYRGQGFGVGLSYVKSIIEAHGGTIELNATYEEGCEFIIHL
ncbi:MAG: HAMP domain-containing sensor histidine kinase [Bacteroidota bacterium]